MPFERIPDWSWSLIKTIRWKLAVPFRRPGLERCYTDLVANRTGSVRRLCVFRSIPFVRMRPLVRDYRHRAGVATHGGTKNRRSRRSNKRSRFEDRQKFFKRF
jgi:hypothetical protein